MSPPYTVTQLTDVEDSAAQHGFGEFEARFATGAVEAENTGLSLHRLRPGVRQPFGHRHDQAEEIYVVISGSGRIKLDDDIVDLSKLDAVRVAPEVTRNLEAGPDGMEVLAFGPRHEGDSEVIPGWWPD
jgi:mannose-6-phosphate isomerase-like protein (cupin superfamily)